MIQLFQIPETSGIPHFDNVLHDSIVDTFTTNFCEYVGAKHGCAVNSATNAIFLMAMYGPPSRSKPRYHIPSLIPPVVLNALINTGSNYRFIDNIDWVGNSYVLFDDPHLIVDSAQCVNRNQCEFLGDKDFTIFSFYPTKPVGGLDGGMIVSNNEDAIKFFKIATMNGMDYSENSWDRRGKMSGWKMYMNSVQAFIANESLKTLDDRKEVLSTIRDKYNNSFDLENISDHIYRITVKNNTAFLAAMKAEGIVCGIHYQACHTHPLYNKGKTIDLPESLKASTTTASIPLHPGLTDQEILKIIKCAKKHSSNNLPTQTEPSVR